MGFNSITLLELIFGLLIPIIVIAAFLLSKKKSEIAFDSIAYGFVSFLASIVAVFIGFMIINALFLPSLSFEDESSGLTLAGTVICAMVVILFAVCESLKISTIKKFQKNETHYRMSGIGFSAGVILAQNVCVFIVLNVLNNYDMDAAYALYSGGIVCITGIMYLVLSGACQVIVKNGQSTAPAYALSSVYYLYWIAAIIFSRSTIMIYTVTALFFILTFVLSGVFLTRKSNNKNIVGEIIGN